MKLRTVFLLLILSIITLPVDIQAEELISEIDSITLASTADITVTDSTALSKWIVGGNNFTIGEPITFWLKMNINEGTTERIVIKDKLPAGMEFSSATIEKDNENISYVLNNEPVEGETGELVWDFETIVNPANADDTDNIITVIYTVIIQDVIENVRGTWLTNTAHLEYTDGEGNVRTTRDTTGSLVIIEPELKLEAEITSTDPYEAGETVSYRLTIDNIGNATAYDVNITDLLPDKLTLKSTPTVENGSALFNQSGQELSWGLDNKLDILPGGNIIINIDAVLDVETEPKEVIQNDVTISWSSVDGIDTKERDYTKTLASTLDITVADSTALSKLIAGGNNFTIGEPITFWLKMNINEGTTERIVIKDILPAGMEFSSATIEKDNENISFVLNNEPVEGETGELVWDLGTIVNPANADDTDNIIIVKYTAIIQDVIENVRGTWLTNTAYLEYTDGEDNVQTTRDTTGSVVIIEPELKLETEITSTGPYYFGDTVTHRITISHTGESNATAYDVKITDILPEGLRFDTYTANPSILDGPIKEGNNMVFGGSGNIDLNPGDSYTFTMNSVLDTEIEPQKSKNYNVKLDYFSIDRESVTERHYSSDLASSVEITDEEKVTWAKKVLKIIYANGESTDKVTKDLILPISGGCETTVSWVSSNEEYISAEGVVTRPTSAVGDVIVTLTGSINLNGVTDTKEFVLTVKARRKSKPKIQLEGKLDGEESKQIEEAVHIFSNINTLGRTVATLTLENDKIINLINNLDTNGENEIEIAVKNNESDSVVTELNGQIVRNMELKDIEVKITTEKASYILPAEEINIDEIALELGENIDLGDIEVRIEITEPIGEEVKVIENEAKDGNLTIIVKPVVFEVKAIHKGKTVTVDKFNSYVKREVVIPEGIDHNKVTTAVVEKDGELIHVPTKVIERNGKYYAEISSLTNSVYTLVWNEKYFDDVEDHWSKEDVNDMASRLIIKGIEENRFEPDREITRSEFVAVIIRALGLAESVGDVEFSDIGQEAWYIGAVKTAYEYGLIKGYDSSTFKPQNKITRQEAMELIHRVMIIAGASAEVSDREIDELLVKYTDSKDIAEWAKKAVVACVKNELVEGYDGKLTPTAYITRAETAILVRRLLLDANLIE